MKYLNKYTNTAAYTADTNRPANETTVSLIQDGTGVKFDGKNVIVERQACVIGDTAVYDTVDLRMKVVKLGTLVIANLPARYKVVGTIYNRDEKQAYMVNNDAPVSKQWGANYQVKLSNLPTTGTFTLTVNALTTAAITAYANLTTMAANIQAALRVILTTATWTATAYADYILVQQSSYTPNVTIFTCSDAGTVVTITTGNYQTAATGLLTQVTQNFRKDGSVSTYAGVNYLKFYSYYYTSGVTNTNQAVGSGNPVKYAVYNTTDNPIIVAFYGAGEAGYANYIQAKMTKKPYSKGVIVTDVSGKANTYKLAAITYTAHDGTIQPAYPAAAHAANYGMADTPFTAGSWWLFSTYEYAPLIEKITYGAAGITTANMDAINKGIYAATGLTARLVSIAENQWLSNEYNAYGACNYYGYGGSLDTNNKTISLGVRCCSAFPL